MRLRTRTAGSRALLRSAPVAVLALVGVLALPGAASAAPPRGAYPGWVAGVGSSTAAGFPDLEVTATGTTPDFPGGSSAFLNAGTPWGAVFGSSQGSGYVSADVGAGVATTSTTTLTATAPVPAGAWGFAVGDVDAETVLVGATGAGGAPVTAAQLGLVGTFNGCSTPVPGSCPGPVPGDVPATADTPVGVLLTGQVPDSTGATAWFRPAVPITALTFTSTKRAGIGTATRPVFQVWVAALAATVSGTVTAPPEAPQTPVADLPVGLEAPDGTPVTDPATSAPVTTRTGPDGTWSLPGVLADEVVAVVPSASGPVRVPVNLTSGDVTGVVLELPAPAPSPPPTSAAPTTPPVAPPPPVAPTTSAAPTAATAVVPGTAPRLAATGVPVGGLALVGASLLAVGGATVLTGRRPGPS